MNRNSILESLQTELQKEQALLANYQDLAIEQVDDDAYVARGNGFCDMKYSEDFIESQIENIKNRIATIQKQIFDLQ